MSRPTSSARCRYSVCQTPSWRVVLSFKLTESLGPFTSRWGRPSVSCRVNWGEEGWCWRGGCDIKVVFGVLNEWGWGCEEPKEWFEGIEGGKSAEWCMSRGPVWRRMAWGEEVSRRSDRVVGEHGGRGSSHNQPSPVKVRANTLHLGPFVPPGHTHLWVDNCCLTPGGRQASREKSYIYRRN